jgi:hypothetical protein
MGLSIPHRELSFKLLLNRGELLQQYGFRCNIPFVSVDRVGGFSCTIHTLLNWTNFGVGFLDALNDKRDPHVVFILP